MANSQFQLKSSDFDRIRREGKRIRIDDWMVVLYQKNGIGKIRFGTSIGRKVGHAVLRNKLKRWLRAFFRMLSKRIAQYGQIGLKEGVDIHVIFRPCRKEHYDCLNYAEFEKKMEYVIGRIGRTIQDQRTDQKESVFE